MPLYTYKCSSCMHEFELITKIANYKDAEAQECPECKSNNTISLKVSAPAFGDPVRLGIIRPDNGFKEVLSKIHEKTSGSELNKHSNLTRM